MLVWFLEAESEFQFVYKRTKTLTTLFLKKKSADPPVSRTHSPFQTATKTLYMCRTSSVCWNGPTEAVLVNSGQEKTQDEAKAILTAIGVKIQ